ncbi:MAG: hypothetical protein NW208_13025 [Bryobacter sp.]|nr:hypothetical protein [Bryobacter sp.]
MRKITATTKMSLTAIIQFDFDKLRRVADCILFFLEVTGSAAYPCIIWARAEGFDIRWSGEPPAELLDRPITVAGTCFALQRTEGRLRVA